MSAHVAGSLAQRAGHGLRIGLLHQLLQDNVAQFQREGVHAGNQDADLMRQVVIHDGGRDGAEQAARHGHAAPSRCRAAASSANLPPSAPAPEAPPMMPHTVPNRPMKGQTLEVVARKISLLSRCVISLVIVRSKIRSMLTLASSIRASGSGHTRRDTNSRFPAPGSPRAESGPAASRGIGRMGRPLPARRSPGCTSRRNCRSGASPGACEGTCKRLPSTKRWRKRPGRPAKSCRRNLAGTAEMNVGPDPVAQVDPPGCGGDRSLGQAPISGGAQRRRRPAPRRPPGRRGFGWRPQARRLVPSKDQPRNYNNNFIFVFPLLWLAGPTSSIKRWNSSNDA